MKTPRSLFPDVPTLRARLTAGLNSSSGPARPVRILKRKLPRFMSTFPNEIVTCRLPDGRKRRVFVKYGAGQSHHSFGHRGDLQYEAEVYRRLLNPLRDFRPKYLGDHTDPATGSTSLFHASVYRNQRLSDITWKRSTRQPRIMARTARWLAEFHADHESRLRDPALHILKCYDAQYYRGWAQRTLEFARPLQARYPWLEELCQRGDA